MRDVRMRGFRERTSVAAALAILEQRVGPLGAEAGLAVIVGERGGVIWTAADDGTEPFDAFHLIFL